MRGQEVCRAAFTVIKNEAEPQIRFGFAESDPSVSNRLALLDNQILENQIQFCGALLESAVLPGSDDVPSRSETV